MRNLKKRSEIFQKNYGRSLVPVKDSIIANEIDELGLRLSMTAKKTSTGLLKHAYEKGMIAGAAINIEPELENAEA